MDQLITTAREALESWFLTSLGDLRWPARGMQDGSVLTLACEGFKVIRTASIRSSRTLPMLLPAEDDIVRQTKVSLIAASRGPMHDMGLCTSPCMHVLALARLP